jgi:hypothetical protein
MVCSARMISAATTSGSTAICGRAAWPPRPRTVIAKLSSLAMMPPLRVAMWPAGMPGMLWTPYSASTGKRSNRPSCIIAFAPRPCSSAGWKMKRTVPSTSRRCVRIRAAPSSIAMCPSWPQPCMQPGFCDAWARPSAASVIASASMSARRPTTPGPSPTRRLATRPVPPRPRCTSRPISASACARKSAVRCSRKPVSGSRCSVCRQRTIWPSRSVSASILGLRLRLQPQWRGLAASRPAGATPPARSRRPGSHTGPARSRPRC